MQKGKYKERFIGFYEYLHQHIIAIIIVVVVLAGSISTMLILSDEQKAEEDVHEMKEYQAMDTVYFAMDRVESLNPLSSQEEDTYYISKLVFSGLFTLDSTLNFQKDLVEEYSVDTENGVVDIKLKNNAFFSDGTKVTAYDVYYTVNQIDSLGKKYPYYEYITKIDYVDVENDENLSISFKASSDASLDNLVFPIVCSENYDRNDIAPVGSGLYKYDDYTNYKQLTLKPNQKYYGGVAKNHICFKVIADKTRIPGLMSIDAVTAGVTTNPAVATEAEDKGLQVTPVTSNEMEYMGFNFKNTYLKDNRFRHAVAKTMDLKSVIDDSYGGDGVTSDSVYFPGFLGSENTGDPYAKDQIGASQLLKECGFEDSDENGVLEDKNGKEIRLNILVNKDNDSRTDAAKTIASELKKVGIVAQVDAVSWSEYKKRLKNKKFDLYLGGYQFDAKYNLKEMFAKDNNLSYNNQDVLQYTDQLETAVSAERQEEIYKKLKPILIEELPYYCICYKLYYFISVKRFSMETAPVFHQRYRGCDTWQWEKILTTEVEKEDSAETKETS